MALLMFRVTFGGLMAYNHGWGKMTRWSELKNDFATPLGMSESWAAGFTIFAEFFCAVLLVLGLFTRIAALPLIAVMGVAFFVIHGSDPIADKESALIYLVAYCVIFLLGPGKFSADQLLIKGKGGK